MRVVAILGVFFCSLMLAPVAGAQPVPPLPVPVVEDVLQRQAAVAAVGGLPVAPGRMVLEELNQIFKLGYSGVQLDELGKRVDDELYPRLGWAVADLPVLLDEVNRFLGLGIDAEELDNYGRVLQESHDGPPRESDVDRRLPSEVAWWDESANTSPNLSGSTLVLVVLLKVPGSTDWDNTFPWYHISTACGRVGEGMSFYKEKAPSQADVSYEVRYYTTTISNSVAAHDSCEMQWMENAFTNLGYADWDSDGTILDDAARYVRDLYGKDNCLILFVPKETGRSYACRGGRKTHAGPVSTVFFYWEWPIQEGWETYAHEMGHLFGACDEYYQSSDGTGCDDDDPDNLEGEGCDDPCKLTYYPFRPWALNENCDRCTDSEECIMNLNDTKICTHTKKQFGWTDHDGDGLIDGVDADPANVGPSCNNGAPEITPPASQVLSMATRQTASTTFTVYWAGTDACGGVASYDIQFKDGAGAWTDWKSAVTATNAAFTGADFHTYTFRSRARDSYANLESWPASHDAMTTFMVGTPPTPVISSPTHPSETAWYGSNDPQFSWTVPVGSNLPLYDLIPSFSWDITRGAADNPDDAYDGSGTMTALTNLADGNWYFHVKGKDWTGTWSATAHRRIRIDTTPPAAPVITSDTHPTSTTWYNNPTLSVQWVPPADSSGIAGYSVVGPDHNPYTNPDQTVDQTGNSNYHYGLTTGTWYVHVRAADNLGHWGDVGHFKVQVDRTPPPPPAVDSDSHPQSAAWYANNDPSFTWTDPVDDSGIGGYSYLQDTQPHTSPDQASEGINPATFYDNVGDGQRYFHIIARDNAVPPNWSASATDYGFKVDTTAPPTVSGIASASHNNAIGRWNNPQSSDNTVEAHWTAAVDPPPGSGVGGYSIVWDHATATLPDQTAELAGTVTSVTSAVIPDGTDLYFHIRSRDVAGNWDDAAEHLGPFYINTVPPSVPMGFWATPGNSRVDVDWWDNVDPDFAGFNVYRSTTPGSGYTKLNAAPFFQSSYADLTVLNGVEYFYVATATDSMGNASIKSVERGVMPEYATPGQGAKYSLAQLVAISNHGILGAAPSYTMNGTVTISGTDTLQLAAGQMLRSSDRQGVRKLLVQGTLLADGGGGPAGRITFGSTGVGRGLWGGIELLPGGTGGIMDSCVVESATDGITWTGSAVTITRCTVHNNSGTGISARGQAGPGSWILSNDVHDNGLDGIDVQADPNSIVNVNNNTVNSNGDDGIQYLLYGMMPSAVLNITNNSILRNTGEGINCGQGGALTLIRDNDIRENYNGIWLEGENGGARPTIRTNNIQANQRAGVHCGNQAMPFLDTNTIVGNLVYGLFSRTQAEPILTNNTITGSQYGVYITQYAWGQTPDLGSVANGTGQNRIHGHSLYSVYNNTALGVRARGNWWGAAATLQMAMNPPPPALGNVTAIWDFFDNPAKGKVDYANWINLGDVAPTITITAPANPPVTVDSTFTVTWNDADPEENAQINIYYDTNTAGLDGTPISGGSGIGENDPANSLVWDTSAIPAGTYYVYGVIDDGFTTASSYSAGPLIIDHAQIAVAPDSLALDLSANVIHDETVTVRNLSANYALHFEGAVTDTGGTAVAWAVLLPDTGTVAAGDSAEVTLRVNTDGFTAGAYAARVEFASDDPVDTLVTAPALDLTVAYPIGAISDTTLDFGSVAVGSHADRDVTVYNTGTHKYGLGTIIVTNDDFSCTNGSFPDSIAPGDSASYTIRFAASELGPLSAMLTFMTDDPYDSTLAVSLHGTGLAADIVLADTSHAFGTHARGDSTTWSFRLWNDGNDTLVVASAGSDHSDYITALPAFPDTLAPGDTATVTVRYRALTEGATEGTITLGSNDPDEGSRHVHLSGTVQKPEVALVPTSHAFGTVRVDTEVAWSFKVHSTGTAGLAVHEITGENPDYAWSGVDLPDTLAAGDSLDVSVSFTPFASGASADTLWVHTDDAETPYAGVAVTGTGGMPALAMADSLHDFGDVLTTGYVDWEMKLRNPGTVGAQVDSITASDDDYDAVETFPIAIAAGDSVLVTVRFAPATADLLAATLTVHSDDLTHPQLWVMLEGRGVEPDMVLSALSHDFGEVLLGGHADWTLRIRNQGSHDLHVSQCAADSAEFSVVSPAFPQTVAAGDSVAVLVRFTPVGQELATGGLHIHSDDPADTLRTVPVVGSGVRPDLFRSPYRIDAVSFEGEDSATPLLIRNVGTGSLAFALSEDDSVFAGAKSSALLAAKFGAFVPAEGDVTALKALDDASWLSVAPAADTLGTGEARTVQVTCDAAAAPQGVYKASLKLVSSDPDSANVYVPVKMRVPRMRFADHHTDSVVFTVTDEGCYGFFDLGQYFAFGEGAYGSGFAYKNLASALSHGAFWVGRDSLHVVDGSYDYDWAVTADGKIAIEDRGAEYGRARFTDASAPAPVGVEITQISVAFPHAPKDDFVTLQYTVKNRTGAALTGVYTGLYADWDVIDYWNDAGAYSATEALGYTYDARMPDSTYYGVCMVSPASPHAFRLVHNPTYVHPTGNITDLNKWRFLSYSVKDAATWQNTDWSMLMSTGPHTIAAGDSVTVVYAVVAGRNLTDLKANAVQARSWGQVGVPDEPPATAPAVVAMSPAFPNPFHGAVNFDLKLPRRMHARLEVFDLRGRLVRRLVDGPLEPGITRVMWDGRDQASREVATGIYFCRFVAGEKAFTRKMLLVR